MSNFTVSTIEQAAIDWLQELGYDDAFSAEVAFDGAVHMVASLQEGLFSSMLRSRE